ncbi:hypothetical protein EP331_02760 [bacterium]|nr:MAG: hypothetical protein EP331_02760 [bacterium]
MPNILIRNVSDSTLEKIKKRASNSNRSIQAELLDLLEKSVNDDKSIADSIDHIHKLREELLRYNLSKPVVESIRDERGEF